MMPGHRAPDGKPRQYRLAYTGTMYTLVVHTTRLHVPSIPSTARGTHRPVSVLSVHDLRGPLFYFLVCFKGSRVSDVHGVGFPWGWIAFRSSNLRGDMEGLRGSRFVENRLILYLFHY